MCELQGIDSKSRKVCTTYDGLCPKMSDVDKLYVPRKVERRSLICIEGYVKSAIRGLKMHISNREVW